MTPELATIKTLGRLLDDLERVRIMNGNRSGALEREFGSSLPHLTDIGERVSAIEHLAELELKRAWRRHPLAPWAKGIKGCGEKLIARLIAEIGDPAERPNVAKLWAYCGHGDPARSQKRKGMTQEELLKQGSPIAKKRVYLLAAQFRRTPGSYYREVYDDARKRYADRVHSKPCLRCGPAGKPAVEGTPWSLGHQDAAALRYVGKEFLKDLWIASRAIEPAKPNGRPPANKRTEPMRTSRAILQPKPTEQTPAKHGSKSMIQSRATVETQPIAHTPATPPSESIAHPRATQNTDAPRQHGPLKPPSLSRRKQKQGKRKRAPVERFCKCSSHALVDRGRCGKCGRPFEAAA